MWRNIEESGNIWLGKEQTQRAELLFSDMKKAKYMNEGNGFSLTLLDSNL